MKKLNKIIIFLLLLCVAFVAFSATDVKNDGDLSTSLVSYWEMEEESGTRVDSHGSNDLTDNNTVLYSASGIQNNAADFEVDNSEYLSITDGNQTGLDVGAGGADWSISLWVKSESTDGDSFTLISKFLNTGNQRTFRFYVSDRSDAHADGDDINMLISQTGADAGNVTLTFDLGTGTWWSHDTWYHIVFTSNGTNEHKVYVDDNLIETITTTATPYNSTSAWVIGGHNEGPYDNMDGLIDEVGVWSKVLTSTEVAALYNSGSGIPYDAGGAPAAAPAQGTGNIWW